MDTASPTLTPQPPTKPQFRWKIILLIAILILIPLASLAWVKFKPTLLPVTPSPIPKPQLVNTSQTTLDFIQGRIYSVSNNLLVVKKSDQTLTEVNLSIPSKVVSLSPPGNFRQRKTVDSNSTNKNLTQVSDLKPGDSVTVFFFKTDGKIYKQELGLIKS